MDCGSKSEIKSLLKSTDFHEINTSSNPISFCLPDFSWVAMMSEECPVPLGSISSAGPGQSEEYGSAHADDIIEEVGPGDDVSIGSDLSTLVVPFPELAPVVFFCLKQTTCPRSWCIRMVSSPYPFIHLWQWTLLSLKITFASALNLQHAQTPSTHLSAYLPACMFSF